MAITRALVRARGVGVYPPRDGGYTSRGPRAGRVPPRVPPYVDRFFEGVDRDGRRQTFVYVSRPLAARRGAAARGARRARGRSPTRARAGARRGFF